MQNEFTILQQFKPLGPVQTKLVYEDTLKFDI